MTNLEIATLFRKVAAAKTILGENRFKILAYENAATAIEHATSEMKDLWDDGKLDTVPGLGKSLISHLDELFRKGTVKEFETLFQKINPAVFPLLNVFGLGPKRSWRLVSALKLKDPQTVVSDLIRAAERGKIAQISGFGKRSEEEILESLKRYQQFEGNVNRRLKLVEAENIANEIINYVRKLAGLSLLKIDKLGSLRRKTATVGDIDLAVATDNPKAIVEIFTKYPKVEKVLEKGSAGASILISGGCQVDLRVSSPDQYGSMLQYFTGSKHHNIKLREFALKKGFSLSEYGIRRVKDGKVYYFGEEKGFYNFLGLDWIPPELREDMGEIEAATNNQLPSLVSMEDIRGDLHLHSNFDLQTSHDSGIDSIEALRSRASLMGYEYIGISDHNLSISKNNPKEIEKRLSARRQFIDKLNCSKNSCRLINLLEIDILPSGELPLSDRLLNYLDGCLVSVHSRFNMNKEQMTVRVLKALSNPLAKILGHPTGRILGKREGYELDWDKIFAFCLKYHKALEINCFPERLDLADVLVREAVRRGVLLSLGTDAHSMEEMKFMEFGVAVARRGWAEKRNIINTWPYSKIISWLRSRDL